MSAEPAVSRARPTAPDTGLLLPAIEPAEDIDVSAPFRADGRGYGQIFVDGHPTGRLAPGHLAPRRIDEHRALVSGAFVEHGLLLYDDRTHELSVLGSGSLLPVPGAGSLIVHETQAGRELCELAADRNALVPLARRPTGDLIVSTGVRRDPDRVVVVTRVPPRGPGPTEVTISTLSHGRDPIVVDVNLGDWFVTSHDAIRGRRLLLYRHGETASEPPIDFAPYTIDVAVLDLDAMEIREVGKGLAGWRLDTGYTTQSPVVRWLDPDRASTGNVSCETDVDPVTEAITTCASTSPGPPVAATVLSIRDMGGSVPAWTAKIRVENRRDEAMDIIDYTVRWPGGERRIESDAITLGPGASAERTVELGRGLHGPVPDRDDVTVQVRADPVSARSAPWGHQPSVGAWP